MKPADFTVGQLVVVSWVDPSSRGGRVSKKQVLARWRSVGWIVEKRREEPGIDLIVLSAHRCTPMEGKEHFEDPNLIPVSLITDVLEVAEP